MAQNQYVQYKELSSLSTNTSSRIWTSLLDLKWHKTHQGDKNYYLIGIGRRGADGQGRGSPWSGCAPPTRGVALAAGGRAGCVWLSRSPTLLRPGSPRHPASFGRTRLPLSGWKSVQINFSRQTSFGRIYLKSIVASRKPVLSRSFHSAVYVTWIFLL